MSERLKILIMIENGEISPEEGAHMLENYTENTIPEKKAKGIDQMSILNQIECGEISSEEGIRLLQGGFDENEIFQPDSSKNRNYEFPKEVPPHLSDKEMSKWKQWWTYPFYIGVGLIILATYWLNSAYQSSGYGFWFFFSWLPLLLGTVLMALSWYSRTGTWLHVRVKSKHQRVAISLPIPFGLVAFVVQHFGQFIPHMEDTSLDEIITALKESAKNENPLYVHVDEGEDGEQVEVFIG
ncbi:MAG: hypothetical protein PVF83_16135 [Anaerolineales bacterium]|jgi:hypothetical protein